jgi:hypothetical protein
MLLSYISPQKSSKFLSLFTKFLFKPIDPILKGGSRLFRCCKKLIRVPLFFAQDLPGFFRGPARNIGFGDPLLLIKWIGSDTTIIIAPL